MCVDLSISQYCLLAFRMILKKQQKRIENFTQIYCPKCEKFYLLNMFIVNILVYILKIFAFLLILNIDIFVKK